MSDAAKTRLKNLLLRPYSVLTSTGREKTMAARDKTIARGGSSGRSEGGTGIAPPRRTDAREEGDQKARECRKMALLKVAKVICDDMEHFCLIRSISPEELLAEVQFPVESGRRVRILISEDLELAGTVSWARDSRIAVRYPRQRDIPGLLSRINKPDGGYRPRMPRLEVNAWARLRVGARVFSARVINISQGGARLRVQGLSTCSDAVLTLESFRPLEGVVRWCDGNEAGIALNERLGLAELGKWLSEVRRPAAPDPLAATEVNDRFEAFDAC